MATNTPTHPKSRRLQPGGIPRSPRLSRSSSTSTSNASLSDNQSTTSVSPLKYLNRSSSASLPEIRAHGSRPASPHKSINRASRSTTTSPRPSIQSPRPSFHRSRSTTKPRTQTMEIDKDDVTFKSIPISRSLGSPQRRLSVDSKVDHKSNNNNVVSQSNFAKLFRSSSLNTTIKAAGGSQLTRSPSPWGLSPRRSTSGPPLAPESPKVKGVSGVLKYFNKQKKVSPAQEEEFHQYKIMHSRLLQWRFANAKAHVASTQVKKKAEEKIFGLWLKLYKMRYAIAEKRMKVERLKQKIKLLQLICPQIDLLIEWEKMEKKNCEAVGRVTRKLSAYSTKLPLVTGALVDLVSLFDAMRLALEVMESFEDTIKMLQFEAEKVATLLRELISTVELNMEFFQEMEIEIASLISLEAHEKSLVVHLMQANTGQEDSQRTTCKHHLIRSFKNKEARAPLFFSLLNVS